MYRIDRHDVPAELPIGKSIEQIFDFWRSQHNSDASALGSIDATTGQYYNGAMTWKRKLHELRLMLSPSGEGLHTNGCGNFTLMSKAQWFRIRAYSEIHVFRLTWRGFYVRLLISRVLAIKFFAIPCKFIILNIQ